MEVGLSPVQISLSESALNGQVPIHPPRKNAQIPGVVCEMGGPGERSFLWPAASAQDCYRHNP